MNLELIKEAKPANPNNLPKDSDKIDGKFWLQFIQKVAREQGAEYKKQHKEMVAGAGKYITRRLKGTPNQWAEKIAKSKDKNTAISRYMDFRQAVFNAISDMWKDKKWSSHIEKIDFENDVAGAITDAFDRMYGLGTYKEGGYGASLANEIRKRNKPRAGWPYEK